jgi:hypothetical protein
MMTKAGGWKTWLKRVVVEAGSIHLPFISKVNIQNPWNSSMVRVLNTIGVGSPSRSHADWK